MKRGGSENGMHHSGVSAYDDAFRPVVVAALHDEGAEFGKRGGGEWLHFLRDRSSRVPARTVDAWVQSRNHRPSTQDALREFVYYLRRNTFPDDPKYTIWLWDQVQPQLARLELLLTRDAVLDTTSPRFRWITISIRLTAASMHQFLWKLSSVGVGAVALWILAFVLRSWASKSYRTRHFHSPARA
eukprot:ANDGO_05290.mRNA.1 hypothetical protein